MYVCMYQGLLSYSSHQQPPLIGPSSDVMAGSKGF